MSPFVKVYYFFCLIVTFRFSVSFEPISSIGAAVGAVFFSASYATWKYTECTYSECCDSKWIKSDVLGLKNALKHSLHGQHLVEHIVARSIKRHVETDQPEKALVMGFHGWTGSGKNYASKIIAENLYTQGMDSKFVHLYLATKHFSSSDINEYKKKIQNDIERSTKFCGRNLFIFDELDKMPPGILDAIKPYVDYYEKVEGVDYRKNIFIFLSNAGGSEITRIAFNFWLEDKRREDITMKDIESYISKGAFNEKGGLHKSEIIKRELIDIYVPFLPLEKKHVKLCIQDILRNRKHPITDDKLTRIADQMEYSPPDFQLYSTSGCKKVSQKVDIYSSDDDTW